MSAILPFHSNPLDQQASPRSDGDSTTLTDEFDELHSECSLIPDTISRRRRHGEYFHRPPVWYPRSCSLATSPTSPSVQHAGDSVYHQQPCVVCPSCNAGLNLHSFHHGPRGFYTMDHGYESDSKPWMFCDTASAMTDNEAETMTVASARDSGATGAAGDPECPQPPKDIGQGDASLEKPFSQSRATLCTRLRLCRDIRLDRNEAWAMQEGSLVMSIDPSYLDLKPQHCLPDEFDLKSGDLYVVCRMYADLWALCARVSLRALTSSDMTMGFLPLCSVTLAANFSAFMDRCDRHTKNFHTGSQYPGNGQCVMPPPRSHSMHASMSLSWGHGNLGRIKLRLPTMVCDAYNNFSLLETPGEEFVPLDSTIEQLFSGSRRKDNDVSHLRGGAVTKEIVGEGQIPRSILSRWFGIPSQEPAGRELCLFTAPATRPFITTGAIPIPAPAKTARQLIFCWSEFTEAVWHVRRPREPPRFSEHAGWE